MLATRIADHDDEPVDDHIVRLHDVSWADYERIAALRGDGSVPRLAYLEGVLELMSPSREHQVLKFMIGRLLETWCLERDVEFSGYGSWTIASKPAKRAVEPDECYVFGTVANPERPDLAIEVIWTSGGVDKQEIYRALGVRELWFWRRRRLTVHALRGDHYDEIPTGEVLPGIDLELLASFLDRPTASQAIREYRAALRAQK